MSVFTNLYNVYNERFSKGGGWTGKKCDPPEWGRYLYPFTVLSERVVENPRVDLPYIRRRG